MKPTQLLSHRIPTLRKWALTRLAVIGFLLPGLAHASSLAEEREALHARRFLAEDRAELAVSQCRQFLDRFPSSTLADQVLDLERQAWLQLGRPAEALTASQNLAGRFPDSPLAPAALMSAGDCLLALGRGKDAVKAWQRLAQRHPRDPLAARGLLKAEEATPREDRQGRLDLLRSAMELDSQSELGLEARYRWALLLCEEGQDEAAAHLLERVTAEAAPGELHLSALLRLSQLQTQSQRRDEALQTLARPLVDYEDSPYRSGLWLAVAVLRLEQGRWQEAERGLRADLELEDAQRESAAVSDSLRLLLGDALARQGRHPEAAEAWASCARQTPELLARQGWSLALEQEWERAGERWAGAAEALAAQAGAGTADTRLLALSLAGLARAMEETGLAQVSWERVAELSGRADAGAPEALPLAAALLRQGLSAAAGRLLESRQDPPAQADQRGLLRLQLALAQQDWPRALELARIFRERWPASPLAAEAESLATAVATPHARAAELRRRQKELGQRRGPDGGLRAALDTGWLQLREMRQPLEALETFLALPVDASADAQAEGLLGRLQAHLELGDLRAAQDDWEERDRLLARSPWALDALHSLWLRLPVPSPEQRRDRIALLESLRRAGRVETQALAGELLLQWNGLREDVVAQGGSASTQGECARQALAWADSLQEPAAPLLMARALCHDALGEKESARALWQRILQEQAEDPVAPAAARRLALLPDEDGSTRAEVVELLAGDWIWHSTSPSARLEIAVAERKAGRPEVALAVCRTLLDEALALASPLPPAREARPALLDEAAQCQEALGQGGEARLLWLRGLSAVSPRDTTLASRMLLRVARSFHAEGRVEDAQAQCRALDAAYPGTPAANQATRLLAAMDSGQGRHEEALELLERLKPARSADLALRAQWVRALYHAGRGEQGRGEFQRLLKDNGGRVDEDTLKAALNLAKGQGALAQGRTAEAEKAFALVVEKFGATPQAPTAELGLAQALLAQGKSTAALKALATLERRWPQAPERGAAAALRGKLAEEAGNASQTIKELERVADLCRGEARRQALGVLIESAARLARTADEQRALERYLEEFPEALDAMARRIEQARLLAAAGGTAEAQSALRALQARADDEAAAEIQFRLGETAEAARDLPGAILEYEKTSHLADRSRLDWGASALFAAARCWEQLGRPGEAQRTLKDVVARHGADSGHGRRAQAELERLQRLSGEDVPVGEVWP